MHACDPDGIGFAELFTVELNALGFLRLAKQALETQHAERAQALLAMSYHARSEEQANATRI